jgi:hypothetical protein
MSLAEILVKRGLLSPGKLQAALADEQSKGTRLGGYLVEKGILTSDQLALGLAEQFGVPPALEADFVRADPALRKRLVVHQAIELQTIPLFFTGPKRVAVAMANPKNLWVLDRLAFILGATVDPMVTSEVALLRQFEILYRVRQKRKVRITTRDVPIPQQASVTRREPPSVAPAARVPPIPAASPAAQPPPIPAVPPASHAPSIPLMPLGPSAATVGPSASEIRPALRSHRSSPKERQPVPSPAQPLRLAPLDPKAVEREPAAPVAIMEDSLCFTPTPISFIPPRLCDPPTPSRVLSRHSLTPVVVPITSAGAQLAVEQIRFATDQQSLSDSLFAFMRSCFTVGAMFLVSGAVAQGRFGFSDGHVRSEVERLRFSLTLPSCLRIARSRRATFRGSPPPDGMAVQGPLWAALQTDSPSEVLVTPIIVDAQVTLLLYAQSEAGGRITAMAASKMEQVRDALSSSLLRLAV